MVPPHPLSFEPNLQAARAGDRAMHLHVETFAGTAVGQPVTKVIARGAGLLDFREAALGLSRQ